MHAQGIGLLCLQETHCPGSAHFIVDGFLVVLSGRDDGQREWAGVGFVVSPWLRHSVQSFLQFSSRLASISLRVPGGSARFVSAYAPHNGYDSSIRAEFFHELAVFVRRKKKLMGLPSFWET